MLSVIRYDIGEATCLTFRTTATATAESHIPKCVARKVSKGVSAVLLSKDLAVSERNSSKRGNMVRQEERTSSLRRSVNLEYRGN